ncbi:MAG: hypothetical protein ACLUTZ_03940 [Oliverpabstia sp.]
MMAEAKETLEKRNNSRKKNEEIDNPTTSLQIWNKKKYGRDDNSCIDFVDGNWRYLHSDVRISCPAPYLVKGDITVQQEAGTELCLSGLMQPGQTVIVEAPDTMSLTLNLSKKSGAPAYWGRFWKTREKQGLSDQPG